MVCDWPVSYSACVAEDQDDPDCFSNFPEQRAMFEEIAIGFLSNWTGNSLGLCPVSVRPCRKGCEPYSSYWGRGPFPMVGGSVYTPVLIGGKWYNIGCGACGGDACSCTETPSVRLPGPIYDIDSILIDGVELDPTAYRVDDYYYLVRQDGFMWPTCQDFSQPTTEPGTWLVNYTRGFPVPAGGQIAAGILACELAKAACKDNTCQLPERIQSITRQGVSVTMIDDFASLQMGQVGIWLIDSWVASVMKAPRHSTVRSVDVPPTRARQTTWTAPVIP